MARQNRTAAARRSAAARRTDTDDPARSRERALRVLFQADVRGVAPSVTLARVAGDPAALALLDERDVLTDGEPVLPEPTFDATAADTSAARPTAADTSASRPAAASTSASRSAATDTPRSRSAAPSTSASGGGAGASGWSEAPAAVEVAPLDGFTRALVQGVEEHRTEVEQLIARYARRWAISRMPVVDRNVLRLATYELLFEPTPPAVVMDEAIGLAKRMSTDDSGRFVNGVLESIRQQLAEEAAEAAEPDAGDAADDAAEAGDAGEAAAPPQPDAADDARHPDAAEEIEDADLSEGPG